MKSEPSFYEKQHVVLWKTSRRFVKVLCTFEQTKSIIQWFCAGNN